MLRCVQLPKRSKTFGYAELPRASEKKCASGRASLVVRRKTQLIRSSCLPNCFLTALSQADNSSRETGISTYPTRRTQKRATKRSIYRNTSVPGIERKKTRTKTDWSSATATRANPKTSFSSIRSSPIFVRIYKHIKTALAEQGINKASGPKGGGRLYKLVFALKDS
jgi:hypothetical protein